MVLEKTFDSPLDCKEIKPVNPKGNQSWIFIGRTDAEAEASVLWPPNVKSRLTGKDPDAGKDWRQEKGMTEDEMVGWHHWLNEYEFEQTPGESEKQGSLHAALSGVTSSQTRLRDWTIKILFLSYFDNHASCPKTSGLVITWWMGQVVPRATRFKFLISFSGGHDMAPCMFRGQCDSRVAGELLVLAQNLWELIQVYWLSFKIKKSFLKVETEDIETPVTWRAKGKKNKVQV